MKLHILFLALLAGVVMNSFAQLTLTLNTNTLTGAPGQAISFNGTLRNDSASEIFLNGISISLGGLELVVDESPFLLGFPVSLTASQQVSGTFFTVTIASTAPDQTVSGDVTLTGGATAGSSDDLTNKTFQVLVVRPPAPEIAVEQPADTDLTDGVASVAFGAVPPGTNSQRTFIIRNTGNTNLTGIGVTITGPNAGDFTVTASPAASVAPITNTTFTVKFTPSGSCVRTAALHIASNDSDENPFDIALTGVVAETNPPSIICPPNIVAAADSGQNSRSNVTFSVPFSDDCAGAILTQTAGLPSGSTFPAGTTTNRFIVTDASGNTNTCSFTVTIVVPPQLISPAVSNGNFGFSFQTVNGQSYTIQRSDNLNTTNWVFHTNFIGDGLPAQIFSPVAGVPQRFFRVRSP